MPMAYAWLAVVDGARQRVGAVATRCPTPVMRPGDAAMDQRRCWLLLVDGARKLLMATKLTWEQTVLVRGE
jgi:hypothetical protein